MRHWPTTGRDHKPARALARACDPRHPLRCQNSSGQVDKRSRQVGTPCGVSLKSILVCGLCERAARKTSEASRKRFMGSPAFRWGGGGCTLADLSGTAVTGQEDGGDEFGARHPALTYKRGGASLGGEATTGPSLGEGKGKTATTTPPSWPGCYTGGGASWSSGEEEGS